MENSFVQSCGLLGLVLLASLLGLIGQMPAVSGEIIFTNNTVIAAGNTNYEGQDIVIRCTVIVEGTHTFSNVQVAGTLAIAGPSTLNVAGTLVVLSGSQVLCWSANATGQATNQLGGVTVAINASNVVVACGAMIIAWEQPWLPGGQPYPLWGPPRILLGERPSEAGMMPVAVRAPARFGARPQTGTNAAPVR